MSADGVLLQPIAARYLLQLLPQEPDILHEIRTQTQQHRLADMVAARETVAFLVWLSQLLGVQHYLEIGVFTGYSSTAMALVLPENGTITACDISVTHTNIAKQFWQRAKVENKITLHLQPALITLNELQAQGKTQFFDLALIDADKLPTEHYLETCLPLMKKNGVIAIDNITLSGKVLGEQGDTPSRRALLSLNKKLTMDSRFRVITLPVGDGLTLLTIKK